MECYQLSETIGADMDSRFYVDGRRVSRSAYNALKDRAHRLDCFATKARQIAGGRFRRTNYVCAYA